MKSFTICVVITVIISNPVLAVIEAPQVTINGNSNSIQNRAIGSQVVIMCAAKRNYVVKNLFLTRDRGSSQFAVNPVGNRLIYNTKLRCKDNDVFSCFGNLNGSTKFSKDVRLIIPCPPTPDIMEPVVYIKQSTEIDTRGSIYHIRGNPEPTFTGMKATPQGPVNLPIGVEVQTDRRGFILYFHNYTDKEYGTYLIKAENIHGVYTANITYRGMVENPTNLVAWSTSPNSVHVKFRAGETFDVAVTYRIKYRNINGKTSKIQTVTDDIDMITVTLNSLDPGVTYNIFVQAHHPEYRRSLYSNAVTVTTIKQGDPPQPEPDNTPHNIPPTTRLTTSTNLNSYTNPKSYTNPTSSTNPTGSTNPTSYTCNAGVSDDLGFDAGVGIGLFVGLAIAITVVVIAVVCVKYRNLNAKPNAADTSLQQYPTVPEHVYENVSSRSVQQNYENVPPGGVQHFYEVL